MTELTAIVPNMGQRSIS